MPLQVIQPSPLIKHSLRSATYSRKSPVEPRLLKDGRKWQSGNADLAIAAMNRLGLHSAALHLREPFTARTIHSRWLPDPACFLDSMIGSYDKLRSPLTGE